MESQQTTEVFGGRYEVVKPVGQGGMASVYKAVDNVLGRVVAVKVMLPKYAKNPLFMTTFLDEARAAARLSNPHIVTIYDWGQDSDCSYIVTEYVRGIDLRRALSKRGAIHPKKVADIASQVCSALEEAHGKEVVHRDIKSANIMMQATGDIKLMDFGIAGRSTLSAQEDFLPTMGTVQYMSPEQVRGEAAAPQSDLYSLGIVMYELGTGLLPFYGTSEQIAKMQRKAAPIPPQHLNPRLDERFGAIVLRALEKNPSERYADAREMRGALDGYLESYPPAQGETGSYPEYWALAFMRGPDSVRGTIHALSESATLGRGAQCSICIDDPSVSCAHLSLTPRGLYLEANDLASTNGSKRNGVPLKQHELCKAGDTIEIGEVRFKIGCK